MYLPKAFARSDPPALHAIIERHAFGLLIVGQDGAPEAAHIPFLLDRTGGPLGTLRAHVARANPIWRAFDGAANALAVFSGPNAYVSPDWYETPHQVPTWNYIAVHATGRPRLVEDADQVRRLLDDLSAVNEARLPGKKPWTIAKMPAALYAGMTKGIVAFDMPIARLEGKWKLSQNRAAADRAGAIAALEALDDTGNDVGARAVAAAMRRLPEDNGG